MGNRSAIEKEADGEILAMRIGYVFHHSGLCSEGLIMRGLSPLVAAKNSPLGEFFFKGAIRIRS